MNYEVFFKEIVAWINAVNEKAKQYGMDSHVFWKWVVDSITDICERYENNSLVTRQMSMMFEWLNDIHIEMQG